MDSLDIRMALWALFAIPILGVSFTAIGYAMQRQWEEHNRHMEFQRKDIAKRRKNLQERRARIAEQEKEGPRG